MYILGNELYYKQDPDGELTSITMGENEQIDPDSVTLAPSGGKLSYRVVSDKSKRKRSIDSAGSTSVKINMFSHISR